MNLMDQVQQLFDGFQDEACQAWDGSNTFWRPNWKDEVETELSLIRENSPVLLPEDYCELFRRFGGGGIEDKRPDYVMPTMTFWIWDDMEDFDATVEFFQECPNALPLGDDIGDCVYFYVCDGADTGIYMSDKSMIFDPEYRTRIAASFTELFTNTETQRLFRNLYRYGCDRGGDGR